MAQIVVVEDERELAALDYNLRQPMHHHLRVYRLSRPVHFADTQRGRAIVTSRGRRRSGRGVKVSENGPGLAARFGIKGSVCIVLDGIRPPVLTGDWGRGGGAWALPNAPPTERNGEKGRDRCTLARNEYRDAEASPCCVIPMRSLGSCRGTTSRHWTL